jgi:hypothetical protein
MRRFFFVDWEQIQFQARRCELVRLFDLSRYQAAKVPWDAVAIAFISGDTFQVIDSPLEKLLED